MSVELLVALRIPSSLGTADLICTLGDASMEPLKVPLLHLWNLRHQQWLCVWHGKWSLSRSAALLLVLASAPVLTLGCTYLATQSCTEICQVYMAALGLCAGMCAWALLLHMLARTQWFARLLFSVQNECAFGVHRKRFRYHNLHPPATVKHLEGAGSTQWVTMLTVRDSEHTHSVAVVHLPLAPMMWETLACRTLSLLNGPHCGLVIMTNPHGLDLYESICFFKRSGMRSFSAMGTYLLFVFVDSPGFTWELQMVETAASVSLRWTPSPSLEAEGWGCSQVPQQA